MGAGRAGGWAGPGQAGGWAGPGRAGPGQEGWGWGVAGTYVIDANVGNYAEQFVTFRSKERARGNNAKGKSGQRKGKINTRREKCDHLREKREK